MHNRSPCWPQQFLAANTHCNNLKVKISSFPHIAQIKDKRLPDRNLVAANEIKFDFNLKSFMDIARIL